MQQTDEAIAIIQKLGFTAYEAKTYLGLLACQPATAYEVAKKSTVPSSKIYETLNRLMSKGIVQPTLSATEHGQQYVALSPKDFSEQIRQSAVSQTTQLLPLLERMTDEVPSDFIWPLVDQKQIETKALEMVRQSQTNILLSCWPQELDWIEQELLNAESRGVKVALVHFGKPTKKVGATYHHPEEKTLYEEKGGRGLTLVTDSNTVLIVNFETTGGIDASWSKNTAFVNVAEDYVKHDVYITKVTRFLEPEMRSRFGQQYEKLRDVFNADS